VCDHYPVCKEGRPLYVKDALALQRLKADTVIPGFPAGIDMSRRLESTSGDDKRYRDAAWPLSAAARLSAGLSKSGGAGKGPGDGRCAVF